jgi:hypothetical protein
MFSTPLFHWFSRPIRRTRRSVPPRPARCRLALETLEIRDLPANITWIGGAYANLSDLCANKQTGDPSAWSNGLNWVGGQAPGANDTAVFPAQFQYATCDGQPVYAPFSFGPVVDVPVAITGVNMGTIINNQGYSLDMRQNVTLSGASTWNQNQLLVEAPTTFTNNGTLTWGEISLIDNVIYSGATFLNNGTLRLVNTGELDLGGPGMLNNAGTIIQSGTGNVDLGVTLNNYANGRYDFQADSGIGGLSPGGIFTNAGTVTKTAGTGTSRIGTYSYLAFNNSNRIDVETGTIAIADGGGVSTGGTFTVAAGATLDLTGGTSFHSLTGTYTGSGAGTVALASGTLNIGTGGAAFNFPPGLLQWTANANGSFIDTTMGDLTNTGTLSLSNSNAVILEGDHALNNQGTINQVGAGGLDIRSAYGDDYTTLNNQTGATYNFQADSGINSTYVGGTFINAGTLTKTAGTGTSVMNEVNFNGGTINVETGTIALTSLSGTLTGGTFTVAAGATLDLAAGNGAPYAGTYTGSGAGTIAFSHSILYIGSGGATFNFPAGLLQWTGGTLNIPANATLTNAGTLTASATSYINVQNDGALVNNGLFTVSGNGQYAEQGDGGSINNRSLTLTGAGTIEFFDSITNAPTGTLTVSGSGPKDLVYGGTNQGTLIQTGTGTLSLGGGGETFTNQAGALYDIESDAGVDNSYIFVNQGTIRKSGGNGTSVISSLQFRNSGILNVETGTLESNASGTSTGGNFLVAAGATLDLTGGQSPTYTGTYTGSGAGTVALASGTLNIGNDGATFDFPPGLFQWTSGTLFIPVSATLTNSGDLTAPVADRIFLDIDGNGAMVNNGSFTVSGNGRFDLEGTGTLTNTGTMTFAGGGQEFVGSILNAGTIIQTDTGTLNLNANSTLTNQPGALYDLQSDAGITSYGTFVNQGTFQKSGGSGTSALDSYFSNPGRVLALSGTLAIDYDTTEVSGSTLTGGTWAVFNGATRTLNSGVNLTTNNATVILDGPAPAFPNIHSLTTNDGSLIIQDGGSFATSGDFTNLGYVLIDDSSILTVSGNFTQGAAATLEIQLGGTPGTGLFGRLAVAGTANLDGTLTLTPVNGYTPSTGDAFPILTFGTRNGTDFANPPAGFTEVYDDANGILTVVAQ